MSKPKATVKLKAKVESKIRANARRGARALDKISPNWFKQQKLSLRKLDMRSSCECVWGQLAHGTESQNEAFFSAYTGSVGTPGYTPQYDKDNIKTCHFNDVPYNVWTDLTEEARKEYEDIEEAEWAILQDEWEKQIRLRRNAARAS